MKKSLIAIAALAAVGAASAQSSVTLYGLADIGIGHTRSQTLDDPQVKSTGASVNGLQGSRIGLKGVEDLGNGLKAVFNYEFGFTPNNGRLTYGASADARRAVAGLQGSFGSVLLGRDYTPLFNLLAASSVDGLSSFETTTGAFLQRTNGVHYAGNFSGVGVQAFGGYNKTTVATNPVTVVEDTREYGLGLSYANGPFMIGVAGQEQKFTNSGKRTEGAVGGTYDFGAAKLFANYVHLRAKNGAAAYSISGLEAAKVQEGNIGVSVPFGAASVMAGYGRNQLTESGTGAKYKGNDFVVGANYAFSKRTDVYARLSQQDNLKAHTGDLHNAYIRKAAVGLRHKF